MSALQIKSYLLEQPSIELVAKSSEIRRFALAQASTGFYEQLVEKIQQAFGSKLLPNKDEIKTYWLDEENEMVCFSTDAELQYAVDLQMAMKMSGAGRMSSMSGSYETNIFKVYIVRKETSSSSCKRSKWGCDNNNKCGSGGACGGGEQKASSLDDSEDETSKLHAGVVCDGCNGSVIGKRYKCKTCDDYDLCSTCKDKNIHSEHEFVTIERPVFGGRCPWASARAAAAAAGQHHHGLHGNRHAWRHWRQHLRHMQQARQNAQQNQQQQQQNHEQAHAAHHNIHETIRNFMPNIASSIPMVYNQEQLKNVGEYLRQFLDPFGIDVSYYVDNLGGNANSNGGAGAGAGANAAASSSSTTSTSTTSSSSSTTTATNAKAANTAEDKMNEEKMDETEVRAEKPSEEEKSSSAAADKATGESEESVDTVVDSVAAAITTTASAPPARDDLIDLTRVTPSASTVPSSHSLFHAAASALQSVVENPAGASSGRPSLTRPDLEFNGFNLIDMEKEIKFINCIEQLKNMGYSDDGGWLTRLVISKDGNMNAVLDSLHPTKN